MPLEINQERVVIRGITVSFKHLVISKDPTGSNVAEVVFEAKDETGVVLEMPVKRYEGEAFNAWWDAFNSGTALYTDICQERGWPLPAPNAHESEFQNT